jgi:hypothetical protein
VVSIGVLVCLVFAVYLRLLVNGSNILLFGGEGANDCLHLVTLKEEWGGFERG